MPLGDSYPDRCRSFDPLPAGRTRPVPMLAEVVDAVVGVDTHRDTHEVEIASPNGVPIARCSIRNDSTGYAQLLAWIVDHAPGPRLVASIEGSRRHGHGVARPGGGRRDGGQPQLGDRAVPRAARARPTGPRVRATAAQRTPRQGQVRRD